MDSGLSRRLEDKGRNSESHCSGASLPKEGSRNGKCFN